MMFTCWLTKEDVVGPCPVKTCMWSSTNERGCMAYPEPPDMETMTDAALARHKGMLLPELINKRSLAQRRIKSSLVLNEYLDWCRGKPSPWASSYGDPAVSAMVTQLCNKHWPYTVEEFGWRTRDIAFTFHKPSVDQFLAQVGKQIDWLDTIELCMEEVRDVVKIFKTAHRKSNDSSNKASNVQ